MVVAVAVVVGAFGTWVVASGRIEGTSVVALDREPEETRNIVVAVALASDGPVDGIFLLQVSEDRPRPAVLVLPNGLEVDVADRGVMTLAETASAGGMALLVEEVAEYTALDIHHYVRVDRSALAHAVDLNGGIEDCPDTDALACPNRLGEDILSMLAAPEGAVSGPDRVRALAEVGRLVGGEVARVRTLLNPRAALRWADAWRASIRTDHDPGPGGARDFARLLHGFDAVGLDVRILPGLVDGGRLTVAPEGAAVLLDAFVQVTPLPGDVGIEAPRELVAADVFVQVLNGVGRAGMASEMSEFLLERGFSVIDVDNAPRFDPRAPTRIGYADDEQRPLAELVASFLPGAEIVQLISLPPDGINVVVTVGANGTG
jgi:hypothetical protein